MRIGLSTFVLAGVMALRPPVILAQSPSDTIVFIVPADTPFQDGFGTEHAVFIGRPLGRIGLGTCEASLPDGNPMQNVVFIHPNRGGGGANVASVILLRTDAVPAGTQMENILEISTCVGPDGSPFKKYVGTVPR